MLIKLEQQVSASNETSAALVMYACEILYAY